MRHWQTTVNTNMATRTGSTYIMTVFCRRDVVSGTTVRALVLGRFGQKMKKMDLKDTAKKTNKNI